MKNFTFANFLITITLFLSVNVQAKEWAFDVYLDKQKIGTHRFVLNDNNSLKGHVIYIDHFGNVVTNITKKQFLEVAKGRPYEIQMKTKNIKTILPSYSAIAISDKYPIKNYEGEKLAIFNEAGYLEIAIFRSNPSKIGSASSLLGLNYRDAVTIEFKN